MTSATFPQSRRRYAHANRAVRIGGRRGRQHGAFLLEALIGILIFAFGVLGIVGLQAQSLRFTNETQYRAEAIYLANSLISSMWGDDLATLEARYDKDTAGTGYVAFKNQVLSLPGASISGNEPDVQVNNPADPAPPSRDSAVIHVTIYWQLPGESTRHQYSTLGVVGKNCSTLVAC
jgi:type IV pilus assembly protein PilV